MVRVLVSSTPMLRGRCLHSGGTAALRVCPTEAGAGLRLRRVDLHPTVVIPATLTALVPAPRRTVLGCGAAAVSTVEHALSALLALGIADAELQVDGPEVPILDGSAAPLARALLAASRPSLVAVRCRSWRVTRPFRRAAPSGASCLLLPEDRDLVLDCRVDYAHPAIGRQSLAWRLSAGAESFLTRLAPARTFGLLAEAEQLRAARLARGATLGTALVFGERGALNPAGTRFADEPVRHKLVDALGDLALLGGPITAHVKLDRCGHALLLGTLQAAVANGALQREQRG